MKGTTRRLYLALTACLFLAPPVLAEDSSDAGSVDGELLIGYRFVDVGGREEKFREDINLDDGPRLFGFRLDLTPGEGLRSFADRIQLDVTNLGGDPFETFHLSARKYGRYDFSYNRTESAYFYEDIILPVEQAGDPGLALAGDFHHFDFERVRDVASFNLRLNPRSKLTVGFDRYSRRGESTTTLDIQRDEFELDRPIEETSDAFHAAFEYAWPKATLILEERVREYENAVETFLPGQSLGEDPNDATRLDFFFLNQPYSYDSLRHTVRVNARPNDRLLVSVAGVLESLELDVEATETSAGIDFRGNPFTTDAVGDGDIERDLDLFDIDVSYRVTDRVAIVGGARSQQIDQEGDFLFDDEPNFGTWDIETTGAEVGLEVIASKAVTVSGGLRLESRDVELAFAAAGGTPVLEEESTDQDGYFLSLGYRPTKMFTFEGEVDASSYEDPFTLSSPTDRTRIRLRAEWRRPTGFFVRGLAVLQSYENDDSGWDADRDHLSLRVGYRSNPLQVDFGYAKVDTERSIDQLVTTAPGFGGGVMFLVPVLYEADTDFFDGRVRYDPDGRFACGADFRWYDNDGSFAVERIDTRVYFDLDVTDNYLVHFGYRMIDYDEAVFDFDDYDADIAEIGLGYRW